MDFEIKYAWGDARYQYGHNCAEVFIAVNNNELLIIFNPIMVEIPLKENCMWVMSGTGF